MLNVIFFSLVGGLFSLLAAVTLFRDKTEAKKIAKYATPFAAGILLGAAFGDLLPEALSQNDNTRLILLTALLAFMAFFFVEQFLHFFHHHREHKNERGVKSSLIIIGDTLHNALDGVAIGAAFLINVPTGIVASIAVAVHEIPQEIGDFGLLLNNGMEKKKAIIINIISALATTLTAALTYGLGSDESIAIPYLLAMTAGFFIYIAATDVIPEIQRSNGKKFDVSSVSLLAGALLIIVLSPLAHKYIDANHEHEIENNTNTIICHSDSVFEDSHISCDNH